MGLGLRVHEFGVQGSGLGIWGSTSLQFEGGLVFLGSGGLKYKGSDGLIGPGARLGVEVSGFNTRSLSSHQNRQSLGSRFKGSGGVSFVEFLLHKASGPASSRRQLI